DVGRVMEQQLHVPYTDDTPTLAATARTRLRDAFLRADMGITGANFGVADSGTICLVTNEGNGRMVTTLPRVHVAIMGIEKLVPTLADLDRCLKVLARSASGQKLTVYTTMIRGPKMAGDGDGPEELHVVLLDNGRSRRRWPKRCERLRGWPRGHVCTAASCGSAAGGCGDSRAAAGFVKRRGSPPAGRTRAIYGRRRRAISNGSGESGNGDGDGRHERGGAQRDSGAPAPRAADRPHSRIRRRTPPGHGVRHTGDRAGAAGGA